METVVLPVGSMNSSERMGGVLVVPKVYGMTEAEKSVDLTPTPGNFSNVTITLTAYKCCSPALFN